MSGAFSWRGPLLGWSEPGSTVRAHYVSIEGAAADALGARIAHHRAALGRKPGRGAKVSARIGSSVWTAQVMPQDGGTWAMPVRIGVVRSEGLREGEPVSLELEL